MTERAVGRCRSMKFRGSCNAVSRHQIDFRDTQIAGMDLARYGRSLHAILMLNLRVSAPLRSAVERSARRN